MIANEHCWLCGKKRGWLPGGWCQPCVKSYDRMLATGNGTVLRTIKWAVERAVNQRKTS